MANNRPVHFNIHNVHYAPLNTDGTYGTIAALPGAVSLTCDANSGETVFYADGIAYYQTYNNAGYDGELEVAEITDDFLENILMQINDTNHVLVEDANAEPKQFALGFQIDGNLRSTYFWYYVCTASRPSQEANTNEESKEVDTQTLEWKCAPNADGYVRAKSTAETTAAVIEGWFTSVYTPSPSNG